VDNLSFPENFSQMNPSTASWGLRPRRLAAYGRPDRASRDLPPGIPLLALSGLRLSGHANGVICFMTMRLPHRPYFEIPLLKRRRLWRPTGLPLRARPTPATPEELRKTVICSRRIRVSTIIQRLTCRSMPFRRHRMSLQALSLRQLRG